MASTQLPTTWLKSATIMKVLHSYSICFICILWGFTFYWYLDILRCSPRGNYSQMIFWAWLTLYCKNIILCQVDDDWCWRWWCWCWWWLGDGNGGGDYVDNADADSSSSSRSSTRPVQQQWWSWWFSSGPPSPHIISGEAELLKATVQFALDGVCYISEEHAQLSGPPHHRDTLGKERFLVSCACVRWACCGRNAVVPKLSGRACQEGGMHPSPVWVSALFWWWQSFPGNGCWLMVALLVMLMLMMTRWWWWWWSWGCHVSLWIPLKLSSRHI